MRIITIRECESTNSTLRLMAGGTEWIPGNTFLRTEIQTHGRGQRGNTWESEPCMNLTFSALLRPGAIVPAYHFLLSESIAVAVAHFLQDEGVGNGHTVEVKWPNDILVDDNKIAGILIENTLGSDGRILFSIAGIGLNVNQTLFGKGAPNATSMSAITGKYYNLEQLMKNIAGIISLHVDRLAPMLMLRSTLPDFSFEIEADYHGLLWRREGVHQWRQASDGEIFTARIAGVESSGYLILEEPDGNKRRYLFKEVFPS